MGAIKNNWNRNFSTAIIIIIAMMTMIMYIIVPSTICSVSVHEGDICITGDLTFCDIISSSPADHLRFNPIF
jgi:hypothetical protein